MATYLEKRKTVEASAELDAEGKTTGRMIVEHADGSRELLDGAEFSARYEQPRERAAEITAPEQPEQPTA